MSKEIPLFDLTPAIGPGSKSEEETLSYMPMPKEMYTFELPSLPEAEQVAESPETLLLLGRLQEALDEYRPGMPTRRIPLDDLGESGRALLYQVLGEGEVALQIMGEQPIRAQETVLAGVWWLQRVDASGVLQSQWLEVADVPELARLKAFAATQIPLLDSASLPKDILNAGPVLVELLDVARAHQQSPRQMPHVINLSLLPFSPEDHDCLNARLGQGAVVILSRGYGNCRIGACAVPGIWRVQYFNSTDQLILDTLEVIEIPQVACAAKEDLEDSAERLKEMREVLV
ncbi:hydrogenase expression/formation protein [Marinobacterium lutimaris]|uniref:Hydrogenase-1 operon protein HyaF n=1 Tax=Marinobacterium lutimaris TaxID=568106 RepID=A0A1H5YWE0_9GAMM|nr:hydrogenase expression/formation protein [Marinobacterium lutimaris]SEG28092.1 hydrogenase-1 operon protein HyaF [Marinobacterium lutimaris]